MAQAQAAQPGIPVTLIGRVQAVTKRSGAAGDSFRTLIRTPAPDEYSNPATFEVRSRRRIGAEGATVEVSCGLIGYARQYEGKDGTVRTAEHVLQAVE